MDEPPGVASELLPKPKHPANTKIRLNVIMFTDLTELIAHKHIGKVNQV